MAWEFHDYAEQTTDQARLTRLRKHITEVNQKIQANLSSGDQSRNNELLVDYRQQLNNERVELEKKVGTLDSTSPKVTAGFTQGRPI